jgi:hypothetical protein
VAISLRLAAGASVYRVAKGWIGIRSRNAAKEVLYERHSDDHREGHGPTAGEEEHPVRVSDYDPEELRLLAAEWLREHPELIAEAARVVERDPVQRAIAER